MRIWRCRWSGWMRRKLERGFAWLEVISTKLWMDGEEWIEKEVCRQSEEWARRHQTLRKVTELSQNSWSSSSSSWPAPPPSPWPCPSPTSACSCPPPSGQPPWLSWLCPLVFSPLALEWSVRTIWFEENNTYQNKCFLQKQLLTKFEGIIAKSRFPCFLKFEISTILDVGKK